MQSIFFLYKKASLDAPLILSVGGVKGGGSGEDIGRSFLANHKIPLLGNEWHEACCQIKIPDWD